MTIVSIDFTGVTPWRGDEYVRVPEGTYAFTIAFADRTKNRGGAPKVLIGLTLDGNGLTQARLFDHFPLDRAFGRERLAALFASVGVLRKTRSVAGIEHEIDGLIGGVGICEVEDDTWPANNGYPEKVLSIVTQYRPVSA